MEIRDLAKEAVIISEDSTFRDALSLMMHRQTNSLIVVDDDGKLSGEIGVSDLLNAIIPDYLEPDKVLEELATEEGFGKAVQDAEGREVRDFMSVDVEPVNVDDNLLAIAGTAIAHGSQHIPVIDHEGRPIGVISRRGLKHILASYIGIKEE
jgi:CBS domain-containing protein